MLQEKKTQFINDVFGEDFKLVSAHYFSKDNKLHLDVIYREILKDFEIQQFKNKLNENILQDVLLQLNIQKEASEQAIVKNINEYLSQFKIGEKPLFDGCNLSSSSSLKLCSLLLNKQDVDYHALQNIEDKVKTIVEKNRVDDYLVKVEINKKENTLGQDILEVRNKILEQTLQEVKEVSFKPYYVSDLNIVWGKKIANEALPIAAICKECDGVCIAGSIAYLKENQYKPKNATDDSEMKTRFNFELRDSSGSISAVFFPPKALLEKGAVPFEEDSEVIVLCDVTSYNNSLSIKVKEMALCSLPESAKYTFKIPETQKEQEVEEKTFITEVEAEYNIISPQKYSEEVQINLFETKKEVPVSLQNKDFVIFDLETTGLEPRNCEIIEIGAVKIRNGQIIETFSTLIKPSVSIPKEITEITGINNDMVVFAPSLKDIISDFYKFTRDSVLVAHNAAFDTSFLYYHAEQLLYKFDNPVQDTLVIARQRVKGLKNYKLKTIAEHFNIELVNAHRALNDTVATAKVFIELERLG